MQLGAQTGVQQGRSRGCIQECSRSGAGRGATARGAGVQQGRMHGPSREIEISYHSAVAFLVVTQTGDVAWTKPDLHSASAAADLSRTSDN